MLCKASWTQWHLGNPQEICITCLATLLRNNWSISLSAFRFVSKSILGTPKWRLVVHYAVSWIGLLAAPYVLWTNVIWKNSQLRFYSASQIFTLLIALHSWHRQANYCCTNLEMIIFETSRRWRSSNSILNSALIPIYGTIRRSGTSKPDFATSSYY